MSYSKNITGKIQGFQIAFEVNTWYSWYKTITDGLR